MFSSSSQLFIISTCRSTRLSNIWECSLGKDRARKVCSNLARARLILHLGIRQTLAIGHCQGSYAQASVVTKQCMARVSTAMTRTYWGPSLAVDNRMRNVAVTLGLMGPLHCSAPDVAQLYHSAVTLASLLRSSSAVVLSLWNHRHIPWRRQISFAKRWVRLLEIFGWSWSRRDVVTSDAGEQVFLPHLIRKDVLGVRSRHKFRDALRGWWLRTHAPLRPCVAGAEVGIDRDMSLRPVIVMGTGRSDEFGSDGVGGARYRRMLANALWSRNRRFHARKVSDRTCCRCGIADESVKHFLWDCTANNSRREQLRVSPDQLPACLALCGLVPCVLCRGIIAEIQKYLACTFQA